MTPDQLDDLLRLIAARLAALRAAASADYAAHRAGYEQRAADYALVIQTIARRLIREAQAAAGDPGTALAILTLLYVAARAKELWR